MTEEHFNNLRQEADKKIKYYSQSHTPEETEKYKQYYDQWLPKHKDNVASGVTHFGDNAGWIPYVLRGAAGGNQGYTNISPYAKAKAEKRVMDLQKQPYSPDYPDWLKSFYYQENPITYGGIDDAWGKWNAYYASIPHSIYLGNPEMQSAIWHELGHAQTMAQNFRPAADLEATTVQNKNLIEKGRNNYNIEYYPKSGERNFNDTEFLDKYLRMFGGHYPGEDTPMWDKLKRYYNATFKEELRASALGAKMAMEDGVPAEEAWNITHRGLPSYSTKNVSDLGLLNHDQIQATERGMRDTYKEYEAYANLGKNNNQQTSHRFYSPVAMPAYTREEQQAAIAQEMNDNKHWGVSLPLGKRPEGFENTGLWVPGMTPLTPQDKMMDRVVRGLSPRRYENDGTFMDRYNNSRRPNMVQKLPSYNYKDYTTLEQFGHDVFDTLASTDYNDIDRLQNKYWPKEFYIDPHRWRELPYVRNAFRGFGRDGMPTENYKRRAAELLSYPEADYGGMMNRWHYNTAEWKNNFKKKFNIK